MHLPNVVPLKVLLTSDASGNWGCGAYLGTKWFMSELIANYHITTKEFIPIVIAGPYGGSLWHGNTVLAQCDNISLIMDHQRTNMPTAKFDFHIVDIHIKGAHNIQAGAMSWDNLPLFRFSG